MSCSARLGTIVPIQNFKKGYLEPGLEVKVNYLTKLIACLLVVCLPLDFLAGQQNTYVMPVNDTLSLNILPDCSDNFSFVSDTGIHALYTDLIPRSDTLTICPPNQRQRIVVKFGVFDLAAGDSLFAFNDKHPSHNNIIGSGTGVGIAMAFGSEVRSDCSPEFNASGCISFIFKTNGDGLSSSGWKANITCQSRNIQIHAPVVSSPAIDCQPAYTLLTIPPALVTADCNAERDTLVNDTTFVRIINSKGEICRDTCLSYNQGINLTDTFAIGTYFVEYKLKYDSSIFKRSHFSVVPRNLVCNDTLNVGFNANCQVMIHPDMLLESPCDTLTDSLYYEISISLPDDKSPEGTLIVQGTGRAGDYPLISKDLVDYCGSTIYLAKIKRRYYDGLNMNICNDGPQENTCWTYIRFEDKSAPWFTEPIRCDTIYACAAEMTPNALGLSIPAVSDNCDTAIVSFRGAELLAQVPDCDSIATYLVIWQASDQCGNIGERKDTVKIFRPGKDKVVDAPTIILNCGIDDTSLVHDLTRMGVPGLQIGRKENGIFIPGDTLRLTEHALTCNYNVERRDVRVSVPCNDKFFRYWYLLDWCSKTGIPYPIDTQLIEFKDTLPPEIICSEFSTLEEAEVLSLPPTDCRMKINFPLPPAMDKCVSNPSVAEFTVEVLEESGWWPLAKNLDEADLLECDTFRVGYRAFDSCHDQLKEDSCYRYFIITDKTAPVAICTDELIVSLSTGETRINADAIDAGSWDMCAVDTILVRRTVCGDISTYSGEENLLVKSRLGQAISAKGWSDEMTFSCCDAGNPIFAELLVIDEKGNFNTCWMNVTVTDKVPSFCHKLPPITTRCDAYVHTDLGDNTDRDNNETFDNTEWIPLLGELEDFYNREFGDPLMVCEDNLTCNVLTVEQEYQLIKMACGEINIKRRYRAIDNSKNHSAWEEQIIHLQYVANWTLQFPEDQKGTCDSRLSEPTYSPVQNGTCDQLSWDYEDIVFENANNVFNKVLRTYSVINWCVYQPGESPLIIKRNENNNGEVNLPRILSSDSLANAGFIQYTQILKVVDEDAPFLIDGKVDTIILGKGDAFPPGEEDQQLGETPFECDEVRIFQVFARDCNEAVTENLSFKWEFYLDQQIMDSGIGDTFSQIVYPGPEYEVKWLVTDAFSNTAVLEEYYTFVDGLAPIAYCNSGLVAEATPGNRFVRVQADLFDQGSYDNCTDQIKLEKRLWHPVLNKSRPTTSKEVMELPDFLELGCLFIGTQEVSLYVMDEAGNYDYCTTTLVIQNNMLSCSRRSVSGAVMDQNGQAIEEVSIRVESTDNNLTLNSNDKGYFEFTMPQGANYTIRPQLNDSPLNGVSTYDLILLSQHILGIKEFDSPYQYLAADVNRSGTITAFDIVQIRQLILNIIPAFPNNKSWRFVDMDYDFGEEYPSLLEAQIPEEKTIRNLSGDRLGMDFLGIKIGDVNGSAVPNRSIRADGRKIAAKFTLSMENIKMETGKTYHIPVYGNNLDQISGYQFTLKFPDLNLVNIEGGIAGLEHFGQALKNKGILTTSWHSLESHEANSLLFVLTFQTNKTGYLKELISITSNYTPAEAYRFSGTFLNLNLDFKDPNPIPFRMYQNAPNPFKNSTSVGFDLPEDGNILLQVVNIHGQIIETQESYFARGYNEIPISIKNLPEGTYYYQLSTPFGIRTKKMTKVK